MIMATAILALLVFFFFLSFFNNIFKKKTIKNYFFLNLIKMTKIPLNLLNLTEKFDEKVKMRLTNSLSAKMRRFLV